MKTANSPHMVPGNGIQFVRFHRNPAPLPMNRHTMLAWVAAAALSAAMWTVIFLVGANIL